MALTLNSIKPAKGSFKRRKRVGRGNASGHGTTATRGTKGQKSRTGVSRLKLKRLGMKTQIFSIPKSRGFKSEQPKAQVVDITALNSNFKDNEVINPRALLRKGLVSHAGGKIKILGKGELTLKGLKLEGIGASASAKAQFAKTAPAAAAKEKTVKAKK